MQLAQVDTFADGAAVKLIGEKTFEIAKNIVDEVLLVTTDETCAAIKDVFEDTRTLLEPAGALSVAGMKKNEVLYRFTFPERPGALLHFLTSMSAGWNTSLFHYRNHGSDFGRVLVGIQVPAQERGEFCEFLDKLGYEYWDETENHAYQRFLG